MELVRSQHWTGDGGWERQENYSLREEKGWGKGEAFRLADLLNKYLFANLLFFLPAPYHFLHIIVFHLTVNSWSYMEEDFVCRFQDEYENRFHWHLWSGGYVSHFRLLKSWTWVGMNEVFCSRIIIIYNSTLSNYLLLAKAPGFLA